MGQNVQKPWTHAKAGYVQGKMRRMGNDTEETSWGWIVKHLVQLIEDAELTLRALGSVRGIQEE